ncbi:alanine racemase [Arenibacter sp. GZD96]|uniref:alanine racemase n=1 Tax=Aurantibrevibacter litoralis TaxID=3106030 RepID=UPI002AFE2E62|nr:alanine racemase [Arenibacter sp. GZD-96]MEA1784508.1 alanine racemase [Arenibacter sp. GZD-96]
MAKTSETTLEIHLGALAHNYHYLRGKLDSKTKFLGVVKAFAYGSDAAKIALKLTQLGVDYLAVAYADEGVALRKAGIETPILVLHPLPTNFQLLIDYRLEPSIYSLKMLSAFKQLAISNTLKQYPVHLKWNTGLNRLGFEANQIDEVLRCIKDVAEVKIASVLSHLAASEDLNEREFTARQLRIFKEIATKVDRFLGYHPLWHVLNTSGIINYPEAQFDMVRSGIGLYGFGNEKPIDEQLQPVATLKTVISQIHHIKAHETVGYNRAFRTDTPRKTATLPLGHADGIGRIYGKGNAYVAIHGQPAPIIGNVCMDMIMVDVTDIDCNEGDEVIVFGTYPTAEQFAAGGNTIAYELLTGISQRVKRIFIDN